MSMTTHFARTEGFHEGEFKVAYVNIQSDDLYEVIVLHIDMAAINDHLDIHTDLGGLQAIRNACDQGIEELLEKRGKKPEAWA